jgi:serine-type D-Ala-D-Ala carboxypeptidase (penicillin-binding protein 5/6)
MMFRRFFVIALIAALICPTEAFAKRKRYRKRAQVSATSALLMDASSKKQLYAKSVDRRVFPASTTKVMTVLLVLENLSLDQYVTVSANATRVQPTKLDLRAGEQYKVRDLLYAAVLKSANDASVVLAEAVAGSQSKFVDMMNEKARQIGARHTQFANAHGLPSDGTQFTTAHDMSTILAAALEKEFFKEALTYKYRVIYSKEGRRHFLKSHNKALFLNWKQNIYGKTGYTRQAQSCFVGTYLSGGRRYIVAVFGCSKRWEDIKFIVERYGKVDL